MNRNNVVTRTRLYKVRDGVVVSWLRMKYGDSTIEIFHVWCFRPVVIRGMANQAGMKPSLDIIRGSSTDNLHTYIQILTYTCTDIQIHLNQLSGSANHWT